MSGASIASLKYWKSLLAGRADAVIATVGQFLLIVLVYLVVRVLTFKLIDRLVALPLPPHGDDRPMGARTARVLTLQSLLKSAAGFILAFVAVVMVLQAVGYNPLPILATASVAGVAIGFGAQKLVRDVISGFFILIEDQYGVGEYITIGLVSGTVEEMGMRTTKLRDSTGKLYIISNGDITQVCNHSRGGVIASLDVAVPASIDLARAEKVINEVGEAMAHETPTRFRHPFRFAGFSTIGGTTLSLKISGGVRAHAQDEALLDLRARILEAFAANEIALA